MPLKRRCSPFCLRGNIDRFPQRRQSPPVQIRQTPAPVQAFAFWKFNATVWALLFVFGFAVRWFLHSDPLRAFSFTLVQEPIGFLLSGVLYVAYRHYSVGDPFRVSTAAWMIFLSLLATLIQTSIAHLFASQTGWQYAGWTQREEWFFRMTFIWLIYMIWSLSFFALRSKQSAQSASARAHQALEEKQRMELQLLRSQLDPHFLFNSLNSVAAEIRPHPESALDMVRELADYLRYSLDQRHRLITPLSGEMDAVSAYLHIEKARYGDRVHTSVIVEDGVGDRLIPSFLLQPLVENAVKHGLHQSDQNWDLIIRARKVGDAIQIDVINTGTLPPDPLSHIGVGLETLQRRLDLHYPNRHRFRLREESGKVCAHLELEGEPCSA